MNGELLNYQALILMSAAVWRLVGTIREPVLQPLRDILVKQTAQYGLTIYSGFVWLIAFAIGFGYASMSGAGGDMLNGLGWTAGYEFAGQMMTALFIACGSAGIRAAEKLYNVKVDKPEEESIEDIATSIDIELGAI